MLASFNVVSPEHHARIAQVESLIKFVERTPINSAFLKAFRAKFKVVCQNKVLAHLFRGFEKFVQKLKYENNAEGHKIYKIRISTGLRSTLSVVVMKDFIEEHVALFKFCALNDVRNAQSLLDKFKLNAQYSWTVTKNIFDKDPARVKQFKLCEAVTAIGQAAFFGSLDVMDFLLQHRRVDPNYCYGDGCDEQVMPALVPALTSSHTDKDKKQIVVQKLLDAKADPLLRDTNGQWWIAKAFFSENVHEHAFNRVVESIENSESMYRVNSEGRKYSLFDDAFIVTFDRTKSCLDKTRKISMSHLFILIFNGIEPCACDISRSPIFSGAIEVYRTVKKEKESLGQQEPVVKRSLAAALPVLSAAQRDIIAGYLTPGEHTQRVIIAREAYRRHCKTTCWDTEIEF